MTTVPVPLSAIAGTSWLAADQNAKIRDALLFLLQPPSFFGYIATDSGVSTGVSFGTDKALTELWDTDGMHAGTDAFATIQTQGKYSCAAWGTFDANTTGSRGVRLSVNGTEAMRTRGRATSSGTWADGLTQDLDLEVGDVLGVSYMQDSGGLLNVQGVASVGYSSGMSLRWVGLGD